MPFSESSNGESGTPQEQEKELKSPAEYERQRMKQRKQEALNYLIETGRVKTPEEAELYLESLNRLKEKLLLFVRDLFAKDPIGHKTMSYDPKILTGLPPYQMAQADRSLITTLKLEDVDRMSPKLWDL